MITFVLGRRQARPLVKVTVKCPCGRKSSHQVVQEGQQAAALRCDAACLQAGRQQQLAAAFRVEDPAHHVSSFDRNRSVRAQSACTALTACYCHVADGIASLVDSM